MTNRDELLMTTVSEMKREYESTIMTGGHAGATSLIRSKKLIDKLHEFIKAELIAQGVNSLKIYPRRGSSSPELKIPGFLKAKDQDIMVVPSGFKQEIITEGVLLGEKDPYGKEIINRSISINVRSQLSSLAKNYDTLFERTFAETVNLHLRYPKLTCGEVYLVPLVAYDPDIMDAKKVGFKEPLCVPKYIPGFQAINNRHSNDADDEFKYERVCLLIIDFRQTPPKIFNDIQELIDIKAVSKEFGEKYSLKGLTISDFVTDLLKIYRERHGSLDALR